MVGGHTPLCAKHCAAFYGRLVDSVVVARGTREAELAKLLENTYRFVNIALVNEVAVFCDRIGIDVWDVLRLRGTKPFGFAPFTPGTGVGGHCIPVDPLYLASKAQREGFSFSLVAAARQINDGMPEYVVRRAAALLADRGVPLAGAEVLLLGVTYKPDVPDVRESPAIAVAEALAERGASCGSTIPTHGSKWPEPAGAGRRPAGRAGRRRLDRPAAGPRRLRHALLAREARCLFDTSGRVAGHHVQLL